MIQNNVMLLLLLRQPKLKNAKINDYIEKPNVICGKPFKS